MNKQNILWYENSQFKSRSKEDKPKRLFRPEGGDGIDNEGLCKKQHEVHKQRIPQKLKARTKFWQTKN